MKKNMGITLIAILITIIILFLFNLTRQSINKVNISEIKEITKEPVLIKVYDNSISGILKSLIIFYDDDGIEYVETPEGEKIYCNNKNEIAIDKKIEINKEYNYKIKVTNKTIEEKTITLSDDYISNNVLRMDTIKNTDGEKEIEIFENITKENYSILYKLGDKNSWRTLDTSTDNNIIKFTDYDVTEYKDENNQITVYIKAQNNSNNDNISISQKYNFDKKILAGTTTWNNGGGEIYFGGNSTLLSFDNANVIPKSFIYNFQFGNWDAWYGATAYFTLQGFDGTDWINILQKVGWRSNHVSSYTVANGQEDYTGAKIQYEKFRLLFSSTDRERHIYARLLIEYE